MRTVEEIKLYVQKKTEIVTKELTGLSARHFKNISSTALSTQVLFKAIQLNVYNDVLNFINPEEPSHDDTK